MENTIYDVLIIGSGPAGLTAAIYTSRGFLKTLVVAGSPSGGQLTTTTEVDNFPGFPSGIQGPDLVNNMKTQAERFDTVFVEENVKSVSGTFETGFKVQTDSGNIYSAKSIIIAAGASAKWLDIPSETRLRGKGVSACATCDGFFFKNKTVAVVGAGDSAMEESTFLTKFANKVYVIVRGDQTSMRASKIMQAKAVANPKIEFIYNSVVSEVLGTDSVTGLQLTNSKTNQTSELEVQGLFLAIGHKPNTDFLKGFVELDDKVGYVKVTNNTKTSVEGVFVAGDVADYRYRQAVTAAGLGCMAALDVQKFLAEHN